MLAYFYYIWEEPMTITLGNWLNIGDIVIPYGITLDELSLTVMIPVGIVTLCVLIYAIEYMSHDPNRNQFYITLSVFALFMTVLVIGDNYLVVFIGWEFVGVVSYLLISFWSTRVQAMKSALSAILLNRMGDTFFVIALGLMLIYFHAVDYDTLSLAVPYTDTIILNILALLLLLAATAKSAQLGLHAWLLQAMEGWIMALLKFHYMREHPNAIWSSFLYLYQYLPYSPFIMWKVIYDNIYYWFIKNSEKSKLLIIIILLYGQSSGNFINLYKRSLETLREIILYTYIIYINLLYIIHPFNNIKDIITLSCNNNEDITIQPILSNGRIKSSPSLNDNNKDYNVQLLDNGAINYIYGQESKLSTHKRMFYEWLIGFTEGNGSFIINNHNKYIEFIITQVSTDAQVLFYIKKELGFGSVSKQDKNTHHFKVKDKKGLLKIINIFNGKLQLIKTQYKFITFVNRYNETYKTNITILNIHSNIISLNNGWLSGFTDAKGCFTHSYINNIINIQFILSQKNEDLLMNKLALLLNGYNYKLKTCDTTNLIVSYRKLMPLIKYFNTYTFKTKIIITYKLWLWVYYTYKNKDYLNNEISLNTFIRKANKLDKTLKQKK